MYNRYIPQADGTYRRSRIPDRESALEASTMSIQGPAKESEPYTDDPQKRAAEHSAPRQGRLPPRKYAHFSGSVPHHVPESGNIVSFFRQLLPQNFDTEDLIIVLLLLLLSNDNKEDQNSALLTLVIYLFL